MPFPDLKELFNGHMDDAQAFLHAQFSELKNDVRSIRDAVDNLDAREEWFSHSRVGNASGGATSLEIAVSGPKPGFLWILTHMTVNTPDSSTAIGTVYAGRPDPANAIHILSDANFYAGGVGDGEVPIFATSQVVTFALTGIPPNGSVSITLRGKSLRLPE